MYLKNKEPEYLIVRNYEEKEQQMALLINQIAILKLNPYIWIFKIMSNN